MSKPESDESSALELVGLANVPLPAPHLLRRLLREGLEQSYTVVTAARGTVHLPEDTYDTQRRLARAREILADYGRAFTDAANLVGGLQEQELIAAVGGQDETPNQGLTIPDSHGDIRLSPEMVSIRTFDVDQLIGVAVQMAVDDAGDHPGALTMADSAVRAVLELGKFEPQVSKVNAYAADLARSGEDSYAGLVAGTIHTKRVYHGVKFERRSTK